MSLTEAKAIAKKNSEEGYVQHVNLRHDGSCVVSDWYNCDSTVASYENGYKL